MSIAIGIYDLFAYTIPGVFYLYLLNECLKTFGFPYVDINQVSSLAHILMIGVAAFVIGQLMDFLARLYCYRLLYRGKKSEEEAKRLASRYKELNPNFRGEDWNMLLMLIRDKNIELSQFIDRQEASSIMTRNFCFGFSLYALFQFVLFVVHPAMLVYLFVAVIFGLLAFLAFRLSLMFHGWFFSAIFQYGLIHGKSLKEILMNKSHLTVDVVNNKHKKVSVK